MSSRPALPHFALDPPAPDLGPALQACLDGKTKPVGSLGRLESLALQIGQVFGTLVPEPGTGHLLVCAGDHGALRDARGRGLSAYPADVTWQMVENFLAGGAAINVLAREAGLALHVADCGVAHDFGTRPGLLACKVGHGTASWFDGPAMQDSECARALSNGADFARGLAAQGVRVLGFGEMGIGNTASASLLTHLLTGVAMDDCVGRGTGLDDAALAEKKRVLAALADGYRGEREAWSVLAAFGGFEIATMVGAMLAAAQSRMLLLVDGFISSAAALVGCAHAPALRHYCVFSHRSQERGHAIQLSHMQVQPLLDLDLRLGEGTGAALAWPLVRSAAAILRDMASFESAGVSKA
ncbi:nicotinate-nucleotide--dimethylbenzimidazole phosphoribosyltransferase [Methyloversatilis thermotolerans]|uniref:nicotinate-nucleotide--dimethylbenzimidazole phosphoribosyltransferase n=1 Tax=Methyloversatilis thermotolerans TaxID=1346290 RepID=UPI0003802CEB|nr:nicotinate-nucleotide--dimethylbenzimidazole phosphoribosyltransferase [Methyloversatilis thermotolerans]